MNIRPFREIKRRKTKEINVGHIKVGGDNPISVQSMTNTLTKDVKETVKQIEQIEEAGADIVRVSCPDEESTKALKDIIKNTSIPIVADIHFHYKRAIEAAESGAACLRINPGNIGDKKKIKEVISAAKNNGCSIRIGVNGGSLDKDLLEKYGDATPEALVESALKELKYLEDVGFFDIKISVKHSNVPLMIESYRLLAEKVDYPLHLGVTEAGPLPGGLIKSTAGIGTLLSEGIGDTIRYSLTTDPVEEAKSGRALLEYLGLRERNSLDLIACPSCGRAEVDVIKVAEEAQDALNNENIPLQVAVMGCVVNGPGEARSADLGIAAGKNKGHLFIKGEVVRVVNEKEMVDALLSEAKLIIEQGIDARLAAADKNAAEIARKDANDLINSQGDINNFLERKKSVVEISSNTDIEN